MTRHRVATAWLACSAATKANLGTRSPGRKSGSFPEDLDFLFEPLDLTPEAQHLGLLGFAGSERLSRARRELLVAPLAQLPRADIQFSGDVRHRPAALDQALNRLGLILARKPSPRSSVCHFSLLGCSGSLQNPPLRWLSRTFGGAQGQRVQQRL